MVTQTWSGWATAQSSLFVLWYCHFRIRHAGTSGGLKCWVSTRNPLKCELLIFLAMEEYFFPCSITNRLAMATTNRLEMCLNHKCWISKCKNGARTWHFVKYLECKLSSWDSTWRSRQVLCFSAHKSRGYGIVVQRYVTVDWYLLYSLFRQKKMWNELIKLCVFICLKHYRAANQP